MSMVSPEFPVLTPLLNTICRRDPSKNIPDSIKDGHGVNVLKEFQGGEEIFLEVREINFTPFSQSGQNPQPDPKIEVGARKF